MFYSKFYLMFLIYIIKSLSRYYQLTLPLLEHKKVPISHFILPALLYLCQFDRFKKKSHSFSFAGKDGPLSSYFLGTFLSSMNCQFMFFTIFLLGSWYFSYWFLRVLCIFMIVIIYHIYDKDLCVRFAFQCCGCF